MASRPSSLDANVDEFSCRHRGSLVPKQVVSQEGNRFNKRCVKCKVVMHASIEFVLGFAVLQQQPIVQDPSQYEVAPKKAPPADKLTQDIQALPLEQYGDQSTSCWSAYMLGCIHLASPKGVGVFASETDHMKLHCIEAIDTGFICQRHTRSDGRQQLPKLHPGTCSMQS